MWNILDHLHIHSAERKYVSLMFHASDLYASWEPLKRVALGDYGQLDDHYSLIVEGNIFADGLAEELQVEEQINATDTVRFIDSEMIEKHSHVIGANFTTPHAPIQAGIKKSYEVSGHRGAVLAMVKPRHHSLTNPGRLAKHIADDDSWKHRVVITELYTCHSYARLYTPRIEHAFELGLEASVASPIMGTRANFSWRTSNQHGDFKHRDVFDEADETLCYPLFKLMGRYHHLHHGPYMEVKHGQFDQAPQRQVPSRGASEKYQKLNGIQAVVLAGSISTVHGVPTAACLPCGSATSNPE